jgi:hypothetical protein
MPKQEGISSSSSKEKNSAKQEHRPITEASEAPTPESQEAQNFYVSAQKLLEKYHRTLIQYNKELAMPSAESTPGENQASLKAELQQLWDKLRDLMPTVKEHEYMVADEKSKKKMIELADEINDLPTYPGQDLEPREDKKSALNRNINTVLQNRESVKELAKEHLRNQERVKAMRKQLAKLKSSFAGSYKISTIDASVLLPQIVALQKNQGAQQKSSGGILGWVKNIAGAPDKTSGKFTSEEKAKYLALDLAKFKADLKDIQQKEKDYSNLWEQVQKTEKNKSFDFDEDLEPDDSVSFATLREGFNDEIRDAYKAGDSAKALQLKQELDSAYENLHNFFPELLQDRTKYKHGSERSTIIPPAPTSKKLSSIEPEAQKTPEITYTDDFFDEEPTAPTQATRDFESAATLKTEKTQDWELESKTTLKTQKTADFEAKEAKPGWDGMNQEQILDKRKKELMGDFDAENEVGYAKLAQRQIDLLEQKINDLLSRNEKDSQKWQKLTLEKEKYVNMLKLTPPEARPSRDDMSMESRLQNTRLAYQEKIRELKLTPQKIEQLRLKNKLPEALKQLRADINDLESAQETSNANKILATAETLELPTSDYLLKNFKTGDIIYTRQFSEYPSQDFTSWKIAYVTNVTTAGGGQHVILENTEGNENYKIRSVSEENLWKSQKQMHDLFGSVEHTLSPELNKPKSAELKSTEKLESEKSAEERQVKINEIIESFGGDDKGRKKAAQMWDDAYVKLAMVERSGILEPGKKTGDALDYVYANATMQMKATEMERLMAEAEQKIINQTIESFGGEKTGKAKAGEIWDLANQMMGKNSSEVEAQRQFGFTRMEYVEAWADLSKANLKKDEELIEAMELRVYNMTKKLLGEDGKNLTKKRFDSEWNLLAGSGASRLAKMRGIGQNISRQESANVEKKISGMEAVRPTVEGSRNIEYGNEREAFSLNWTMELLPTANSEWTKVAEKISNQARTKGEREAMLMVINDEIQTLNEKLQKMDKISEEYKQLDRIQNITQGNPPEATRYVMLKVFTDGAFIGTEPNDSEAKKAVQKTIQSIDKKITTLSQEVQKRPSLRKSKELPDTLKDEAPPTFRDEDIPTIKDEEEPPTLKVKKAPTLKNKPKTLRAPKKPASKKSIRTSTMRRA